MKTWRVHKPVTTSDIRADIYRFEAGGTLAFYRVPEEPWGAVAATELVIAYAPGNWCWLEPFRD